MIWQDPESCSLISELCAQALVEGPPPGRRLIIQEVDIFACVGSCGISCVGTYKKLLARLQALVESSMYPICHNNHTTCIILGLPLLLCVLCIVLYIVNSGSIGKESIMDERMFWGHDAARHVPAARSGRNALRCRTVEGVQTLVEGPPPGRRRIIHDPSKRPQTDYLLYLMNLYVPP